MSEENVEIVRRLLDAAVRPSFIGKGTTTRTQAARMDSGTVTAYELYVGAGGEWPLMSEDRCHG